jgi:LysR family transcriptional regulator (chromosome initiation inhibitor)
MSWLPEEPRTLLHVYMDDETRTQAMMRSGSVMGCISQHAVALPGGDVTALGDMRFYCVATPEFAARHLPHGLTDDALETAPAVMISHDDPLHFQFLQQSNPGFAAPFPFHLIPSLPELVDVIASGAGFGLVSGLMIGDRLKTGELVDLTPHLDFRLPLYWHRWSMESPLISRLTSALLQQATRLLHANEDDHAMTR